MQPKTFGIILAVSATLSLVACNNGSGKSSAKTSSSAPAAQLATGGPGQQQQQQQLPPPPPSQRGPPINPNDDRILDDQALLPEERGPTVPPALRNRECGEAYRQTSGEWYPGLPNPPAKTPIFTDSPENTKSGVRFTDARQDDLFAVAAERANALPDHVQKASQDFAKQIRDVKIFADWRTSRMVKVQVVYLYQMRKAVIELRGQMDRATDVRLVQVPVPGQPRAEFAGLLTCADQDHGCKNIILRLDTLNLAGDRIVRSAFIVHRWGDAHITMSDAERKGFARLPNQNYSAFAEYLSNTVNNSCLNILADVSSGRRQLPQCALQRLQASCGSEDVKRPSARAFGLRSWAAVYGKSAFELTLLSNNAYDGVADYDRKRAAYFSLRGPLAFSAVRPPSPMWKRPLFAVGETRGIAAVYLMTNDGGGNLNLQFDFKNEPEAHMRLNVSSLLPDTGYALSVVENARQMPQLPVQDVQAPSALPEEDGIPEPPDLK